MADSGRDLTHYYHANASGWGGEVTRPVKRSMGVLAPTSLPIVGGHVAAVHEDFGVDLGRDDAGVYRSIFVKRAYTEVSGGLDPEDNSFHTVAKAEIEGLNLLNIFYAERISLRIDTYHPPVPDTTGDFSFAAYYPAVSFSDLKYEGLTAHGARLIPEVDALEFFKNKRKPNYPDKPWPQDEGLQEFALEQSRALAAGVKADATLRDIPVFQRLLARHEAQSDGPNSRSAIDQRGNLLISIVNGVKIEGVHGDDVKSAGNVLYIRDLGRVFLGELIVDGNAFNLNMLRVDMGSAAGASGSGPGAGANGSSPGGR